MFVGRRKRVLARGVVIPIQHPAQRVRRVKVADAPRLTPAAGPAGAVRYFGALPVITLSAENSVSGSLTILVAVARIPFFSS